jgi:hypothetical protein
MKTNKSREEEEEKLQEIFGGQIMPLYFYSLFILLFFLHTHLNN